MAAAQAAHDEVCVLDGRAGTSRAVQRVHMKLGRRKREWPRVELPAVRGNMMVADVLVARAGDERYAAIADWCRSVWSAVSGNREMVTVLLADLR